MKQAEVAKTKITTAVATAAMEHAMESTGFCYRRHLVVLVEVVVCFVMDLVRIFVVTVLADTAAVLAALRTWLERPAYRSFVCYYV